MLIQSNKLRYIIKTFQFRMCKYCYHNRIQAVTASFLVIIAHREKIMFVYKLCTMKQYGSTNFRLMKRARSNGRNFMERSTFHL